MRKRWRRPQRRSSVAAATMVLALLIAGAAAVQGQDIPVNTGLPERVIVIERDGVEIARFTVELALTPTEQAIGLMGRTELASDRGMLFIWPTADRVAMWMKNTLIPLDFLFIRPDGTIASIVHNVQPCPPQGFCPAYAAPEPVNMVLEVGGGRSRELGIEPGDRLVLPERRSP
ncbi:MAG: hypothetical protein BAA04_06560 [Firmicutes bacterium ZCTH02-B6]|nr:MAG: hypothetical protein BAA04_06560 [Firmicutes bacterium ZCTH02-B6]